MLTSPLLHPICAAWLRNHITDDGTYICVACGLGEVLATQQAACLRAIHKFKIKMRTGRSLRCGG